MPRGNAANLTNAGKGRPPGIPNKDADIKALARSHGKAGIAKLAELAGFIAGIPPAKKQEVQVVAIKELLDRGYGRPAQAHTFDGEGAVLGFIVVPEKSVGRYNLSDRPTSQEIEGQALIEHKRSDVSHGVNESSEAIDGEAQISTGSD